MQIPIPTYGGIEGGRDWAVGLGRGTRPGRVGRARREVGRGGERGQGPELGADGRGRSCGVELA